MTVIDPQTFLPGTYCSVPCYLLSNGTVQPLYHGPGSGMFDLAHGTQYYLCFYHCLSVDSALTKFAVKQRAMLYRASPTLCV